MPTTEYKLKQAQYARIYGVTERSVRTYQGEELPLDEPGTMSAFLSLRKTPPPGLKSPAEARLLYSQEIGIPLDPTPERTTQLEEIIWRFWDAHNDIVTFARGSNWPRAEEIAAAISGVSTTVQTLRALAGIPDRPAGPGEDFE